MKNSFILIPRKMSMSHTTLSLTNELYQYLLAMSLREPPILQALRAKTRQLDSHEMQIAPDQAQFMRLLIEVLGAQKTLDIGFYTGYSALTVALALPEEGQVVSCEVNPETAELGKIFWKEANMLHKLDLHLAPALETLNNLLNENQADQFDFAFIDADKENYPLYYEKCLLLLRQGGVILIDNVLWKGKVLDNECYDKSTQAIRTLNQSLLKDERVTISMVALGDGVTLARKR